MEGGLEELVAVGWYLNLESMEGTWDHLPERQVAFALVWSQLWQDQRCCLRRSEIEDYF